MPDATAEELRAAVEAARSWRGVLRNLGWPESSSARVRWLQRRARELELPTDHLTGVRTWSDAQLVRAVRGARSWSEVASALELAPGGNGALAAVRRRAARLALSTEHLDVEQSPSTGVWSLEPDPRHLAKAGPMLAAAWFTLRGYHVHWPLEPCRYDLLASRDDRYERVQVKTTTHRPAGVPTVSVSTSRRRGRAVYGPSEVDHFFVVDDQLDCYLIPAARLAGRYQIALPSYEAFRVATAGTLLSCRPKTG